MTQEVIDHLAEMVQELCPHVGVVAEQDRSKILDGQVLSTAVA